MKSLRILLVFIAGVVAIFYFLNRHVDDLSRDAQSARPEGQEPPNLKVSLGHGSRSARDIYGQPIPVQTAKSGASEAPQECQDQWRRLTQISFDRFLQDVALSNWKLMATCADYEKKNGIFVKTWDPYEFCRGFEEKKEIDPKSYCHGALLAYRAGVINWLTRDDKDYRAMATSVLVNKIIAQFFTELSADKSAEEMVDVLLEREPLLVAAHKMKSVLNLTREGLESKSAFDSAKTLYEMAPEDSEAFTLHFVTQMFQDRAEALREVRDYVKRTGSAHSHYLLASYYWKASDREKALSSLKEAARLDSEYVYTYQRAKATTDTAEKIFQMRIGIDPRNL